MMNLFTYRKMLNLEVMNRYYRNLQSPDLDFSPSADCRRILSRYGMAFRKTGNGFSLYAEVNEDGKLKKPVEDNLRLTFFGILNNNSFENFTDLPLERGQKEKFIFNNLAVNSQSLFGSGETSLLLNQGDHVTSLDLRKIVRYGHRLEKTMSGDELVFSLILEPEGRTMDSQTIKAEDGVFYWQHHMRDLPAGNYRLEADGTSVDEFYFNPEKQISEAYAVLEIFTDVPVGNQFIINHNQISEKTCRIAFLNRSTIWRYKATNRNNHTLPDPAIAIGSNTGLFTHDGNLVFTSANEMELTEEPVKGISFLKNISSLSTEILSDLPNPDTCQILPVRSGGSVIIYSDIFIYL